MITPVMPTYARADLAFARGEGAWLFDENGERYLDFAAGIAVCALGHAHPHLVAALNEQASRLWHTSNLYRIPSQEKLARRLVANSFADTVFFTNSGVEAIECGLKTIRRHFADTEPRRYRVITLEGSFHGRSIATISAAGQEKLIKGFDPLLEGFDRVVPNDIAALEAAIGPETAAVLLEPIQGEGGIRVLSPDYMQAVRALCDKHGLLLMLDEIQTGIGRTGRMYAYQWAGIEPDIMAIAKGLGGGFPVGACLAREEAAKEMTPGSHGTTFGGNPLAMAVGNAVLDIIDDAAFLDKVSRTAGHLQQALSQLPERYPAVFEELRGTGLMLGLKCAMPNTDVLAKARAQGLLLAPGGDNVVRLLPPLTIGEEEISAACKALETAAEELSS